MIKLKFEKFLLVSFCFFFALISWKFISELYKLGSFEGRSYLSYRPVIIEWKLYKIGEPLVLEKLVTLDTYISFAPAKNYVEIVSDPDGIPELYLKNKHDIVYPILIQTKNSGLPTFMVHQLAKIAPPSFALYFPVWIKGLLAMAVSIVFIRRKSNLTIPFVILACVTPQFVYFAFSDYPDTTLSLLLALGILLAFDIAEKRRAFIFIGALIGFTMYVKLASLIFAPAIFLFYWRKIKKNFLPILLGASPFLIFILVTMNESLGGHLEHRMTSKNLDSYVNAIKHFYLGITNPAAGLLFRIKNGQYSIETVIADVPVYLATLILSYSIIGFLTWKYLSKIDFAKIFAFIGVYCILITTFSFGLDRDFYVYTAMGTFFVTVLFISNLKPKWSKRTGLIILAALFSVKLVSLINWKTYHDYSRKGMNGCVWIYDCMIKDWKSKNLIDNHPLLTLYFLDVGQIEFFSGEKIIPTHLASYFTQDPTLEQFEDFMKQYRPREFRFLVYRGKLLSGSPISSYVSEERLRDLGFEVEVLSSYDFPEHRKSYQLLKVVRK